MEFTAPVGYRPKDPAVVSYTPTLYLVEKEKQQEEAKAAESVIQIPNICISITNWFSTQPFVAFLLIS